MMLQGIHAHSITQAQTYDLFQGIHVHSKTLAQTYNLFQGSWLVLVHPHQRNGVTASSHRLAKGARIGATGHWQFGVSLIRCCVVLWSGLWIFQCCELRTGAVGLLQGLFLDKRVLGSRQFSFLDNTFPFSRQYIFTFRQHAFYA